MTTTTDSDKESDFTTEDYWTEPTTEEPTETEFPKSDCCGLIPDEDTSEPPIPEVTTEDQRTEHSTPSERPSSSTEDKWQDTTTLYHTPGYAEDTTDRSTPQWSDTHTDHHETTPIFTDDHEPSPSRPSNTDTWTKVYTEKFSTILPNGRRIWISISTSVRAILRIFGIGK